MSDERVRTWFVPGRIEVLGKHTDYAGGRSLICAIDRGFRVTSSPRGDDLVRVTDEGSGARSAFRLAADVEVEPGDWSAYARTVARRLARNFSSVRRGADIAFRSTLPPAAGLSSSSVFVVSVYFAIAAANDLEQDPDFIAHVRGRESLAAYLACVENGARFGRLEGDRGVGTSGGSEDHTATLCASEGMLKQYSFAPLRLEREIPFPGEYVFAIGVSGVSAEKTGTARERYNTAVTLADRVLQRWRAASARDDETLAGAVAHEPGAHQRIREALADQPELLERFEHFVEESEILVPAASAALAVRDFDEFARVADRSQQLAAEKLHNQVPETVGLHGLARASGATAASAFGAGFGGSVWALVRRADAGAFITRWREAYASQFPEAAHRSQFFTTAPAAGATEQSHHA